MRALLVVCQRLALGIATLVLVSVILFAASEVLPGDAATQSLGPNATTQQIEQRRAELDLNRPWPLRYGDWLVSSLHGNLGTSATTRRPVRQIVAQPLAYTSLLVALAGGVTLLLSTLLGTLAGLRPGSTLDRLLTSGALVTVSIPQFVTAGLLVFVFASTLRWLPAVSLVPIGESPVNQPAILVLPVVTLAAFATAWASRLVRAMVIDASAAPNVEAARLAGVPDWLVVWRHVLPATISPAAQMFGWLIGSLFGGTAVVEQVFSYPGLSNVLISAVRDHDAPLLEGVGLILAAATICGLLLADLVSLLADPRIRVGP